MKLYDDAHVQAIMCASGETRSATASCATMGRSVAVVATLALNVVINDVPATCPAARFQVPLLRAHERRVPRQHAQRHAAGCQAHQKQ
jgi:hypothetical protein